MINLTQKTCYSATPNELKKLFMEFFQKTYNYKPEFSVHFDTYIWLPIVVNFKQSNTASFLKFWNAFQSDILRLKNKHGDEEFELGDKILRMILNKDTDSYLFHKECSEYVYDNSEVVHIFVKPNATLSLEEEDVFQEKLANLQKDMSPFIFTDADFNILQTEKSKLFETYTSVESGYFILSFSYENDQQFFIVIDFEQKEGLHIKIVESGFCPTPEMQKEIQNISKEVEALCKEKLKQHAPQIKMEHGTILAPNLPITYFDGLTPIENIVLSLNKIHHLGYENIADLVGKTSKHIDLTMQRIYMKYNSHKADQTIAKILPNDRK